MYKTGNKIEKEGIIRFQGLVWFGLVCFYDIYFVYLMPNPVFT